MKHNCQTTTERGTENLRKLDRARVKLNKRFKQNLRPMSSEVKKVLKRRRTEKFRNYAKRTIREELGF